MERMRASHEPGPRPKARHPMRRLDATRPVFARLRELELSWSRSRRLQKDKAMVEIFSSVARPTRRGPAEYFIGTVWQDPVIEAPAPARIRATRVAFEPGARTAWHTHPLGQTLHVLTGVGRVQSLGGPMREIRAGDTVWI